MSEEHKKRLVLLFWVVVCVTMLPPLFFGEPRSVEGQTGGDSWRNFIFDFQTLIGGGAAIIAAWYTIRQMRISDARSDDRHRELIALQMRADRLRVERMLHPSLVDLEVKLDAIRSLKVSTLRRMIDSEALSIYYVLQDFLRDCDDVLRITSRGAFTGASELVDGNLTYALELMHSAFSRMGTQAGRCQELAVTMSRAQRDSIGIDVDQVYEDLVTKLNLLGHNQAEAVRVLEIVCDGLAQMRKEYKIHF